jgi:hypothetical protein
VEQKPLKRHGGKEGEANAEEFFLFVLVNDEEGDGRKS